MTEDISITELHLCSECKYSIDEPDEKTHGWKTGCLTRGKPNPSGGPCECNHFEGV